MIRFLALGFSIVIVMYWAGIAVQSAKCDSSWGSYEHTYSQVSGCMVRVNGLMTPEANVRVGQ